VAAVLGSVAGYAVLLTLVCAGAGHLARPGTLRSALVTHGVLPVPGLVAVAVPVVELGLGAAGVAGLFDRPVLLAVALAGAAVLLAGYAGYGWRVLAAGSGGPCGCSRHELPMSGWVLARAGGLAGLAVLGLTLTGSVLSPRAVDSRFSLVLLAAATFSLLLWQLPAAMYDPTPAVAAGRATVAGPARPAAGPAGPAGSGGSDRVVGGPALLGMPAQPARAGQADHREVPV